MTQVKRYIIRCSWSDLSSRSQRFLSNSLNFPFQFSLYLSVSVESEEYSRLVFIHIYISVKNYNQIIILLGCICEWLHSDSSKRLGIQTRLYTGCIWCWSVSCSSFRNIFRSINPLVVSFSHLAFLRHLEHDFSCWSV